MADRPTPDTDWLALADRLDKAFSDLRAAADGLRQLADLLARAETLQIERDQYWAQLAAITTAIDTADGAQFARLDAERTKGEWVHRDVTQFVAGWDEATARLAASLTPTPTPHLCPTCDSDDPEVCNTDGERHTPDDWDFCCPDAWHNSPG